MYILLDIAQKISDTQGAIRKLEQALRNYPHDNAIILSLESLNKRAAKLENDFLVSTHQEHLDVCAYGMFSDDAISYPIVSFGSALQHFQRWFTSVYDALKSGPKKEARPALDIVKESTLDFAFSYTGSLGVVMTIPSERMLFQNDLQLAMNKTVEMIKSENDAQIRKLATELGIASIRAFYHWIEDHVKTGTGADVKWLRASSEIASVRADNAQLRNLGNIIQKTSDVEEKTFDVKGTLVGADTTKHTFHMSFDEGEDIRGTMAEQIGKEKLIELPKIYLAKLKKSSFVNYSTEKEFIHYHLLSLK